MSQENVQVVQRFIDHFNETGDFPWELVTTTSSTS